MSESGRAERSAEAIYHEKVEDADEQTSREAYEREMAERGRSDEAGKVGEHLE